MSLFHTLDSMTQQRDFAGKTVLLRADLNVPAKDGVVTDETRIERLIPTLRLLMDKKARIVILSHFGRPDGKPNPKYSLAFVGEHLSRMIGAPVAFAGDCIGPVAQQAVAALQPGGLLLLENTRFHPEEEANDPAFAKAIAAMGDLFVHDAFSAAHRAHATTAGLAAYLPCCAGLLMQEELDALHAALLTPKRPVAAIVGGAKISTKLDLLGNLIAKVDVLILGGAMANTFLAANGHAVGASLFEPDMLDTARAIEAKAKAQGCKILLPHDVVVAKELRAGAPSMTCAAGAVPDDQMILDLGPESAATISAALTCVKTLVWNGPLGVFETPPFDAATNAVAKTVADLTQQGALMSIAGGGDTAAALAHAGITDKISYLSSAGGAFLEWLEGKTLPGVAALMK